MDLYDLYIRMIGQTIVFSGYVSTTITFDMKTQPMDCEHRTLFSIRVHAAADVREYSACSDEEEMVIMARTVFKVLKVHRVATNVTIVELDEVANRLEPDAADSLPTAQEKQEAEATADKEASEVQRMVKKAKTEQAASKPSFRTSHFKKLYDSMAETKPSYMHEIFAAVLNTIQHFCSKHGIPSYVGKSLFKKLEKDVLEDSQKRHEMIGDVAKGAQGLWTSARMLDDDDVVPNNLQKELCSMINEALREDSAAMLPSTVVICRAINQCCVVRGFRKAEDIRYPTNGLCYRGSSMPDEHKAFFTPDVKFRFPQYVSTSFSEDIAFEFLYSRGYAVGMPPVLYIIQLDPRGQSKMRYRCKHVNYISNSHVEGEDEFLFAPYSVFTVTKVDWQPKPCGSKPHVIHLEAALDNKEEEFDDLPLAPWC